MKGVLDHLFQKEHELSGSIWDAASLSAGLAAISLAIFTVMPTFRSLIEGQGKPGYGEYASFKLALSGFRTVGISSALFSIAVISGIGGHYWPCRLILYIEHAADLVGTTLFFVAIRSVWKSVSWSLRGRDRPQ